MGLPIKHRKKYVSHKKKWDKQTIVDEAVLVSDYSIKNKNEIRKIELLLSKYKKIAKEMNSNADIKKSEEAKNFIEKLKQNGFLTLEAESLDEVLDIKVRDILERRLANIVYKMKLAKSPSQARQFVTHKHIRVGGKIITSPTYLVSLKLEPTIEFSAVSSLADENHPERRLGGDGMEAVEEEMEQTPLKAVADESFDEKEAKLDEEEQDEDQNN